MIARIVEAILKPVLELAATLMRNLFLAPFRALFGKADEADEDALDDEKKDAPQLEDAERQSD